MNYDSPIVKDNRSNDLQDPQAVIVLPIVAAAVYTTAVIVLVVAGINTAVTLTVTTPSS